MTFVSTNEEKDQRGRDLAPSPYPTGVIAALKDLGVKEADLPTNTTTSGLLKWTSERPFDDLEFDLIAVWLVEEEVPAVRRSRLSGPHLSRLGKALEYTTFSCRDLADRMSANLYELHHDAVSRSVRGGGFIDAHHALTLAAELSVDVEEIMTREDALAYVSLDNLRIYNLKGPKDPDRPGLITRLSRSILKLFQ